MCWHEMNVVVVLKQSSPTRGNIRWLILFMRRERNRKRKRETETKRARNLNIFSIRGQCCIWRFCHCLLQGASKSEIKKKTWCARKKVNIFWKSASRMRYGHLIKICCWPVSLYCSTASICKTTTLGERSVCWRDGRYLRADSMLEKPFWDCKLCGIGSEWKSQELDRKCEAHSLESQRKGSVRLCKDIAIARCIDTIQENKCPVLPFHKKGCSICSVLVKAKSQNNESVEV